MAKGQSLYVSFSGSEKESIKTLLDVTYNTNKHLFGKVALFPQYLINTFSDKVFLKIHDYWRNNANHNIIACNGINIISKNIDLTERKYR